MNELINVLDQIRQLLEHDFWELISIIISGAALIFAILVPVRIANKQNKIALFEKRFEAYANLLMLKAFSDILKKKECSFDSKIIAEANPQNIDGERGRRSSEVLLNFQSFFYKGDKRPDGVDLARVMLYTVRNLELSLQTLPMLYSKNLKNRGEDANKEITKTFEDLAALINSLVTCDVNSELHRTNFIAQMDLFADKYSNVFEKGIRLK